MFLNRKKARFSSSNRSNHVFTIPNFPWYPNLCYLQGYGHVTVFRLKFLMSDFIFGLYFNPTLTINQHKKMFSFKVSKVVWKYGTWLFWGFLNLGWGGGGSSSANNGSVRLKFNIFDNKEFLHHESKFLEHFRFYWLKDKFGTLLTYFSEKIKMFKKEDLNNFFKPNFFTI